MSDALRKVDGVELVQIKLNSGKALLDLKQSNTIQLQGLRKAVASRGFEPGSAAVVLKGIIQQDGEKFTCKVLGTNDSFLLVTPESSYPTGPLWIEGTTDSESSPTLKILQIRDAVNGAPPLRIRDLVIPASKTQ